MTLLFFWLLCGRINIYYFPDFSLQAPVRNCKKIKLILQELLFYFIENVPQGIASDVSFAIRKPCLLFVVLSILQCYGAAALNSKVMELVVMHNQDNFPGAKLVVRLVITKTNIFTLELVVIISIIYFVI